MQAQPLVVSDMARQTVGQQFDPAFFNNRGDTITSCGVERTYIRLRAAWSAKFRMSSHYKEAPHFSNEQADTDI
jgi:hypothetical protein